MVPIPSVRELTPGGQGNEMLLCRASEQEYVAIRGGMAKPAGQA